MITIDYLLLKTGIRLNKKLLENNNNINRKIRVIYGKKGTGKKYIEEKRKRKIK